MNPLPLRAAPPSSRPPAGLSLGTSHTPEKEPGTTSQSGTTTRSVSPTENGVVPVDEPTHVMTLYEGAQYKKLTNIVVDRPRRGGGRRGPVSDVFTANTRRNMQDRLAKIPISTPYLAVDITYPTDWERYPEHGFPTDPSEYNKQRNSFISRVRYKYPDAGVIWRIEFQKERGALHYHSVVFGLPDMPVEELQVELSQLWFKSIQFSGTPEEHPYSVQVSIPAGIVGWKARLGYLAKRDHRQLRSHVINHSGRWWGISGKKNVPIAEEKQIVLCGKEGYMTRRAMRTYRDKTSNRRIGAQTHNPSITLRRGTADDWERLSKYYAAQQDAEREYVDTSTGEVGTRVYLESLARDRTAEQPVPSPHGSAAHQVEVGTELGTELGADTEQIIEERHGDVHTYSARNQSASPHHNVMSVLTAEHNTIRPAPSAPRRERPAVVPHSLIKWPAPAPSPYRPAYINAATWACMAPLAAVNTLSQPKESHHTNLERSHNRSDATRAAPSRRRPRGCARASPRASPTTTGPPIPRARCSTARYT
jgi:hypothetical protein